MKVFFPENKKTRKLIRQENKVRYFQNDFFQNGKVFESCLRNTKLN